MRRSARAPRVATSASPTQGAVINTTADIPTTTTAGPGTFAGIEVLSWVTFGGWSLNHAEGVVR